MYSRRDFLKTARDLTIGGLATIIISSSGCKLSAKETRALPDWHYGIPIDDSARFPDLCTLEGLNCVDLDDGIIRIGIGNASPIDSPSFEVKIKAEYGKGMLSAQGAPSKTYEKTYKVKGLPGAHHKYVDFQVPKEAILEGAIYLEIDPYGKIKETRRDNNKDEKGFHYSFRP